MSLLFVSSARCLEHVAAPGHPEQPARLRAIQAGLARADLDRAVSLVEAQPASIEAVSAVHDPEVVATVEQVAAGGGGHIDADTGLSAASFEAARLAAGAGLEAIARLEASQADTAFCAIRPPGHHATPSRSMGFCLFNNVAVAARRLADAGERVAIIDYDAHHGNGTQDAFYGDPRVLFVSFHQWPCYPGTGRLDETGSGDAVGTTLNLPLPPGATGDVYLAAWDRVVAPSLDAFAPTWVLVSAGFDAHRADPLTQLGLSAGDYVALTRRVLAAAPAGRRILLLEGGYDLEAMTETTAAVLSTIVDHSYDTEAQTSGGPGIEVVDRAVTLDRSPG